MIILADANVAVLIDFENVGLDAIQFLLDQLSDVGRIIIKRAYGDWSVQRNKQEQLIEQGIEAIHQYRSNRSGKNSSDIRLAIEAIDLFHTSPIDTFVIVSSDSDFVPLVGKLRSSGKTVIGSGRREATSSTLVRSCDRYIFLDDAKKRTPVAAQPVRRPRRRTTTEGDANSGDGNSGDGVALALRAYEASINDQGYVAGSKLYQTMRRIDPGFDYRVMGFRTFTQFLESISEVEINRPQNGGDVQVTTKQGRDQASASVSSSTAQPSTQDQRGGMRRGRPQRPFQRQEPAPSPDQQPPADESPTKEDQPSVAESTSDAEQPSVADQDSEPKTFQPPFIEPDDPIEEQQEEQSDAQPDSQPVAEVAETELEEATEKSDDAEPEDKETEESSTNGSGINWEREVDAAWTRRQRNTISGRAAATDAAKALNVDKLSSSQFPSLEKLLKASTLLQLNWRREGNTIVKK